MAKVRIKWIDSESATNGQVPAADGSGGSGWLLPVTFSAMGGRSNNATNAYVFNPADVALNLVPFILPFTAYLVSISAATDGAETWTAEVHVNGSLKTGATLGIVAADNGYSEAYGSVAQFGAGDKIQLYVNGTSIYRPFIVALFRKA